MIKKTLLELNMCILNGLTGNLSLEEATERTFDFCPEKVWQSLSNADTDDKSLFICAQDDSCFKLIINPDAVAYEALKWIVPTEHELYYTYDLVRTLLMLVYNRELTEQEERLVRDMAYLCEIMDQEFGTSPKDNPLRSMCTLKNGDTTYDHLLLPIDMCFFWREATDDEMQSFLATIYTIIADETIGFSRYERPRLREIVAYWSKVYS